MASRPPKFQYNPTVTDIWRMLPGVQRQLAEESDSGYANEIATAANMLSQHDRQLEDYLTTFKYVESVVAGTNITVNNTDPRNPIVSSSGGSSAFAFTQYEYETISAQGYGFNATGSGFLPLLPGINDNYSFIFSNPTIVNSSGSLSGPCLSIYAITMNYTIAGGTTTAVQAVVCGAVGGTFSNIIFQPVSSLWVPGVAFSYAVGSPTTYILPDVANSPFTQVVGVVAPIQQPGSTLLGPGAVTLENLTNGTSASLIQIGLG